MQDSNALNFCKQNYCACFLRYFHVTVGHCDDCFRDAALHIINSDKWQLALRSCKVDRFSGNIDTPMRKLIAKMPGQDDIHEIA